MPKVVQLLSLVVVGWSFSAIQPPRSISIGGLKPLRTRLGDAMQAFTGFQVTGVGDDANSLADSFATRVGGCELGVRADRPMSKSSLIEIVSLTRKDEDLKQCINVRIGSSLTINSGRQQIESRMPWLKKVVENRSEVIYSFRDASKCNESGGGRYFSITIKVRLPTNVIEYIIIEDTKSSCADFRAH